MPLLNILIMAGGKGERFWPKSRINHPKQLLNLTGNGSMIQETVRRVLHLTDPSHVYIVTNALYDVEIREQLPEIPATNIIIEPEGRNTAPCIGLASLYIAARDPEGVMAVLASDHIIQKPDLFCALLRQGAGLAEETGGIVTLGVTPDRPETGYGYIKTGEIVTGKDNIFTVERFTEKPDYHTAIDFVESGRYLWNSGIFLWKIATIRQLIAKFMPQLDKGLQTIAQAMHSPDYERVLADEYAKMEKISIDYGIMERAPEVYVIPADIGWDDVGSWLSLERVRAKDPEGNVLSGELLTTLDLKDCIFDTSGDRLVTAIGLRELIYVETADAVLICPKSRAQDVKLLLEKIKAERREKYL